MKVFIRGMLVVSLATLYPACGGSNDSPPNAAKPDVSKADLRTRIEEYWQARIQGNMQLAFEYEHPDQQEKLGEKIYQARVSSNVNIREFSVTDLHSLQLQAEAEEVTVPLKIKYEYMFPVQGAKPILVPTTIQDHWEKQHGVWYHVLDTQVITNRTKPN